MANSDEAAVQDELLSYQEVAGDVAAPELA
jgi:hypothetical protein